MPKYLVTGDSYYQPFTYEEIAKPLLQETEAMNAVNDEYDKLSADASLLDRYIDETNDPRARKIYDDYMSRLKALQENLWGYGLNSQTRRYLSEARAGYNADIGKLSALVQARQNSSAAFWKKVHDNPETIYGYDPGTESLDKYLDDENFGDKWYSYNGTQFMTEVGADIASKASAIERESVLNNQEIPGYIFRMKQKGITSDEIDDAIAAIKAGSVDSLDEGPVKMIAETIQSHINKTGAQVGTNITPEQYNRFFDYARMGAASGIKEPSEEKYEDKEWASDRAFADHKRQKSYDTAVDYADWKRRYDDQQQGAWDLWKKEYDYQLENPKPTSTSGSGSGKKDANPTPVNGRGYVVNTSIASMVSEAYRNMVDTVKRQTKQYENGKSYFVNIPDTEGEKEEVRDYERMTELVFNPEFRSRARRDFGGLDIALDAKTNFWRTEDSRQHGRVQLANGRFLDVAVERASKEDKERYNLPADTEFVLTYSNKGERKVYKPGTEVYNDYVRKYDEHVQKYIDANPELNFDKLALNPVNEQRKIRDDKGYASTLDTSDLFDVMKTEGYIRDNVTGVPLVTNATPGMDMAIEAFGNTLINSFRDNAKYETGNNDKVGKDSRWAFRKIGKGGKIEYNKIENDITKVIPSLNGKDLDEIKFLPDDLVAFGEGKDGARPMFRFSVHGGDMWSGDAAMLGPLVWNQLTENPIIVKYGNAAIPMNACQLVAALMFPIEHPAMALDYSDEEAEAWSTFMYSALNKYDSTDENYVIKGPKVYDEKTGKDSLVTLKDIVHNRSLQAQLYAAIIERMNDIVSIPRDLIQIEHPSSVGESTGARFYMGN